MLFSPNEAYWYVLFVYNGKENKVVGALKSHFKGGELFPFVPKKDKWFIGKGKKIKEKKIFFPGYVFIETTLNAKEFIRFTKHFIETSHDIIRLLHNSDDQNDIVVKDRERKAWVYLLGDNKCVEESVGFIENDKVFIEYGPLRGLEGTIKKINRHKREAYIEVEMMGRRMKMSVAVQIIKKICKKK